VSAGGNGSYTLTVTNPATNTKAAPAVEVNELLPAGIVPAGISGSKDSGWQCDIKGQQIVCKRSDDLRGGASYPDIAISYNSTTAACPAFNSTAYLSVNGVMQSSADDDTLVTGCFSLEQEPATKFNISQKATYKLTVGYLGDNSLSGTLTVRQTLPRGLSPKTFASDSDGTPLGDQDWLCSISPVDPQSFACDRPAAGTYASIFVTVDVGIDACPSAPIQAVLQLDYNPQVKSNPSQIPILGACPGIKLTLNSQQDTNPSGGVFTPGMKGGAIYKLIVTNTSTDVTAGTAAVTDQFNPGLRPTAVSGSGWTCDPVNQIVSCQREDSLLPGQSYPPIFISVAVDPGACPAGQDSALLSLGGKTQDTKSSPLLLRGCINLSNSSLSYPPVVLGSNAVKQSIILTASDKDPLKVTLHPLPAGSAFSFSSAKCADVAPGKDCKVELSQGAGILLDVVYKPACIGTQSDSLLYETDVPSSGTVQLSGQAVLQNLSFVELPGGDDLTNRAVAPNTSIDVGLNPTPGYCIGQASTITPRIVFGRFQRTDEADPIQYDESVTACPAGSADCIASLKTGTVAGTITLGAQFTDSQGQDIGYAGNSTVQVTIPEAKPVITDVKLGTRSESSFQLKVVGFSTPRKNTQACFKFSPSAGSQLNTASLDALNNCYAQDDIAVWYERTPSLPTGSEFMTAITFSFAGDPAAFGTAETWLNNAMGDSERLCLDFKSGVTRPGACQ
jgi:hypothetical protein